MHTFFLYATTLCTVLYYNELSRCIFSPMEVFDVVYYGVVCSLALTIHFFYDVWTNFTV